MTKGLDSLHVLDSNVWIDLVEWHPDLLHKLEQLARLAVVEIGVPDIVRLELTRHDPKGLHTRKKNWEARVAELERFAHLLARTEDLGEIGERHSSGFLSSLKQMKIAIQEYEGDPNNDLVVKLLTSKCVTRIPTPKAIHAQVIEQGIHKKKPFASRNGVADASLLFSTLRWARRHSDRTVCFYTLNHADFSDSNTRKKPHPDIADFFAPNTNIRYCPDLRLLAESVKGLDPLDFVPRDPHGCDLCEGKVLIESITCLGCGNCPSRAPDDEGYSLRLFRGGYLVDVHPYEDDSFRLECDTCGRRTFEVYLDSLCSYHQHMTSKDD